MRKTWIFVCGVFLAAGCYGFYTFNNPHIKNVETAVLVPEEEIPEEDKILFGIKVNDLEIIEGVVEKNQTLSTILGPFNVPYQIIDEIAKKSKEIFDVKHIAFNKKYTVLTPKDSLHPQFFIYEPNHVDYVVFNLNKADVYKESKPIELKTREVGGTITRSLYMDMVEQGIGPDLIDQFADLYGWTVDFQRLQKGDKYKVVFNEKLVGGQVIGIEGIKTAYFEHLGEPNHAIPFEQNGQINFFDKDGNSFKKEFLRDPLKFTRISSRYNLNRFHPVQKRYKAHLGTDYAAPKGTEIRSVGDGTVVAAGYTGGNGNYVKIKHNGTYSTQYLHMSKIGNGIRNGVRVKQGQVIGYVGSTGLATGPHLCFRFWKRGKQVDWLQEEIPPSEPIAPENRMAFERVRTETLEQLAAIDYGVKQDQPELLTSR